MSRYLDIARQGSCERAKREKCELVATASHRLASLQPEAATNSHNSQFASSQRPYQHVLAVIESRCPDLVDPSRWRLAVEDGKRFVGLWGEQASSLGWTARDLFGLHTPPAKPHPSYSRLSRYDETGLVWLLQGREVVAFTEATAAIQNSTGAITIYRRHKPAPALRTISSMTSHKQSSKQSEQ
jgi:hypothetical protein